MEKITHIILPLPLIAEIFKNPTDGISDILDYGIYKSSTYLEIDEYNAYRQALYCYYRGGLTSSLKRQFKRLVNEELLLPDEDYNGFSFEEFNPEENISELELHCEKDEHLRQEIIEFHKLRQAKDILGMTYSIEPIINIHKKYGNFEGSPTVSVRVKMMFDFYENKKTDYEKALLAMFLGIRSIIGRKSFACTTGEVIKYRMFGTMNKDGLKRALSNENLQKAYKKYTTDYHYKKMLKDLLAYKFLSSEIGYARRTYVSCRLSMSELKEEIIEKKKKSITQKRKAVSEERKSALNYIKEQLR